MIHVGDCREVMRTLAPNSVDGADLTLTVRKPRPPASSGQIEIDV